MPMSPIFFSLSCFILSAINILIISEAPPTHSKTAFIAFTAFMATLVTVKRRQVRLNIEIEMKKLRRLFADLKSSCIALENVLMGKPRSQTSRHQSVLINGLAALVAVEVVLALCMPVTNGDAQLYNLSRVSASIISGTFPPNGGNQYQSYYEYGHDYLYAPDLAIGNTTGLGALCLLEWLLCFTSIIWITRSAEPKESRPKLAICSILFLSWPVGIFQAISVKNDLCIALYCLALYQVLASGLGLSKEYDRKSHGKSRKAFVCLYALSFGFMLVISKGYGFIGIIAIIVPLAGPFVSTAKRLVRITLSFCGLRVTGNKAFAIKKIFLPKKVSIYIMPVVLVFIFAAQLSIFSHFRAENISSWQHEYAVMRQAVSTNKDVTSLSANLSINSARYLIEGFFHTPIPIEGIRKAISIYSSKVPITSSDIGLRQGYFDGSTVPFKVSEYFGEDIAWPSPVITILSVLALVIFTGTQRKKFSCSYSEPSRLYLSSVILMLSLVSALKWSPWNVRYFTSVYFLAIPYFATLVSGVLREK